MRVAVPGPVAASTLLTVGAMAVAGAALVVAAPPHSWPLVVSLVIAPVLEETVFRAGVQDGLLHVGVAPWRANLLTAIAFSAAHMLLLGPSLHTALVWMPALLIGAAYNCWRRVRFCIALHMAMNAAWIAMQPLP